LIPQFWSSPNKKRPHHTYIYYYSRRTILHHLNTTATGKKNIPNTKPKRNQVPAGFEKEETRESKKEG
jgi:hypothetical protein